MRRHPVLFVVTLAYSAGLLAICLTPDSAVNSIARTLGRVIPWASDDAVETVLSGMLFVPVGLLFMLLAARRRWLGVVLVAAIAAIWLELAEMVWTPSLRGDPVAMSAHIVGAALGVGIAVALPSRHRRERGRLTGSLTPVAPSSGSQS